MIVLLRGFLKKCVSEIQKKLLDQETRLGVLSKVQGLLRAVGEKEAMQESEKSDDSLDRLDLSGHFQQQFSPVKPPTPNGPNLFVLQAMKEAHRKSLAEVTSVFRESLAATVVCHLSKRRFCQNRPRTVSLTNAIISPGEETSTPFTRR